MSDQGAMTDISPDVRDPNPIIDTGCPRSVGGIDSAIALSNAMGIEFALSPLDCPPFIHGYGMKCSEPKVTIGVWMIPMTDLNGISFKLPFYIVNGDGVLLLGNDVCSKSNTLNDQNLLIVPPGVGSLSDSRLALPIYNNEQRTHLLIVPAQTSCFATFFASARSLYSSRQRLDSAKFSDGKFCKWFAFKLHAFTHYTLEDMLTICKQANVLTPPLVQALQLSIKKCTSCGTTGRPHNMKKVSFDRLLREFNEHVQVDFFYIVEISKNPILHARDKASGFSATIIVPSRDMIVATKAYRKIWVNIYGPPATVSADPEFNNRTFRDDLSVDKTTFEPRAARRHNKTGSVESRHGPLRIMAQRLKKDAEYLHSSHGISPPAEEILARSTFLCNALRGNSKLSSFELAKGYQPSILGLPQTSVSKEILDAYREQQSKRSISRLLQSKNPSLIKEEALPRQTAVYYFVKDPSGHRGKWKSGYVFKASEHTVAITPNPKGTGAKSMVAYEDIRLMPTSPLLFEITKLELELNRPTSHGEGSPIAPIIDNSLSDEQSPEGVLWCNHPLSRSFFTNRPTKRNFDERVFDIGTETDPDDYQKDVGDHTLRLPTRLPLTLESSEQHILSQIKEVYGYDPVTKSKLKFVPSWVLDAAEAKEKENYMESIRVVDRKNIPRNANVISSHFFFKLKKIDGEGDKLELKCRCVPHGNRDKIKQELRSDSSTAQFPVIRTLLSLAAYHKFTIAKLDIKGAYLQAGTLSRDIYVRPPTSWMSNRHQLWKMLRPAYGLVESGRTWQLACESWMNESYGLVEVPGLPQLFVLSDSKGFPLLIIAKVVDDFLLAGYPKEIKAFHGAISVRFDVGTFIPNAPFEFNALHIEQDNSMGITISMQEYVDSIDPIDIPRARKKEHTASATAQELTNYLSLAGTLNFLGHGVLPAAAFAASHIQQRVGNLTVADLKDANSILREISALNPSISYKTPPPGYSPKFLAFADGAQGKGSYGQSGYVGGLYFQPSSANQNILYHITDWYSGKQSRISFSSIGCEILAAATACDRASNMVDSIQILHNSPARLPLVFTVDSLGLYGTITTLHEGKDYRLRATVSRLRDSFEAGEVNVLQWIRGTKNISDGLTKRNPEMFRLLNSICISGCIDKDIFELSKRVLSK